MFVLSTIFLSYLIKFCYAYTQTHSSQKHPRNSPPPEKISHLFAFRPSPISYRLSILLFSILLLATNNACKKDTFKKNKLTCKKTDLISYFDGTQGYFSSAIAEGNGPCNNGVRNGKWVAQQTIYDSKERVIESNRYVDDKLDYKVIYTYDIDGRMAT